MKARKKGTESLKFKPFTVEIDFEDPTEVALFWLIFNKKPSLLKELLEEAYEKRYRSSKAKYCFSVLDQKETLFDNYDLFEVFDKELFG